MPNVKTRKKSLHRKSYRKKSHHRKSYRKKYYRRKSYRKKSHHRKSHHRKYIFRGGMITEAEEPLPPINEFNQNKSKMETLLANPDARRGNMFNAVCNQTTRGFCLDFGSYRNEIKHFFKNYSINTGYPTKIKRIGVQSNNGIILQIEYERDNYKSYSIIKCNQDHINGIGRDNLLYEYFVGIKFINKLIPIFPCFVETYEQLYFFDDVSNLNNIKTMSGTEMNFDENIKQNFREVLNPKNLIEPLSTFASNACKFGKKNSVAIMLQHYDNFYPFDTTNSNIHYDAQNILFQVYYVLNILKDNYTHYDLHSGNVYLYKPYLGDKYIEMNYHFNNGKVVSFPTEFIAKIIDYGRNYFNDTITGINSKIIFDYFCRKTPECVTRVPQANGHDTIYRCGEEAGILSTEYVHGVGRFYYIAPHENNISHDLLLVKNPSITKYIPSINEKGVVLQYDSNYGTPEIVNPDFTVSSRAMTNSSNRIIANVSNLLEHLKYYNVWNDAKFVGWKTKILSPDDKYNKYASPKWTKMGEMYMYEDMRPYEFIPSTYSG